MKLPNSEHPWKSPTCNLQHGLGDIMIKKCTWDVGNMLHHSEYYRGRSWLLLALQVDALHQLFLGGRWPNQSLSLPQAREPQKILSCWLPICHAALQLAWLICVHNSVATIIHDFLNCTQPASHRPGTYLLNYSLPGFLTYRQSFENIRG